MTAVNIQSDVLTNVSREVLLGLPNKLNPLYLSGGKIQSKVAYVPLTAAVEGNGSTYRAFRIASRDRISALKLTNAAIAGLSAVDIGLWLPNGGAVVSQYLFAQGVNCTTANAAADCRFTLLAATTIEQRVWEILGLSSDPGLDYDVTMTATTRGNAGGALALEMYYVTGSS